MSRLFGGIRQIGVVVRDFDVGLAQWTKTYGVGPFYVGRHIRFENYFYRGKPAQAPLVSLGFCYSRDIQIELIQQEDDTPSGYLDFLATGREGVQHVSSQFQTMAEYEEIYERAHEAGHRVVQEGSMGPARFAYFETTEPPMILSYEICGGLIDLAPQLQMMQDAAANWDGTHPVRDLTTGEPV